MEHRRRVSDLHYLRGKEGKEGKEEEGRERDRKGERARQHALQWSRELRGGTRVWSISGRYPPVQVVFPPRGKSRLADREGTVYSVHPEEQCLEHPMKWSLGVWGTPWRVDRGTSWMKKADCMVRPMTHSL